MDRGVSPDYNIGDLMPSPSPSPMPRRDAAMVSPRDCDGTHPRARTRGYHVTLRYHPSNRDFSPLRPTFLLFLIQRASCDVNVAARYVDIERRYRWKLSLSLSLARSLAFSFARI